MAVQNLTNLPKLKRICPISIIDPIWNVDGKYMHLKFHVMDNLKVSAKFIF